ncbi:MAG: hypothetical protein C5B57_01215 [Blastocatellia bacterium]|nr:MAG: hypothetical protein C5B57_01215 [Blastocatellia bacterium]
MPPLAEVQARITRAIVRGDSAAVASMLASPGDPRTRLAIHHRHYTTSLVTALVERFSATMWLLGSQSVVEAARAFVRDQPPSIPCIAEYGEAFPAFLAVVTPRLPYVKEFATLEWHVGRLALAVDEAGLTDLSVCHPARIAESTLRFQSGLQYLRLGWPVDELLSFYLEDTAPESYTLAAETIWLEIRGNRGSVARTRLSEGAFTFRKALTKGTALGDAAVAALAVDPAFDPTRGLSALMQERLIVAANTPRDEGGQ